MAHAFGAQRFKTKTDAGDEAIELTVRDLNHALRTSTSGATNCIMCWCPVCDQNLARGFLSRIQRFGRSSADLGARNLLCTLHSRLECMDKAVFAMIKVYNSVVQLLKSKIIKSYIR